VVGLLDSLVYFFLPWWTTVLTPDPNTDPNPDPDPDPNPNANPNASPNASPSPDPNQVLIRLVQGRPWLHRVAGRSLLVGDTPWVAQSLEAFTSKL